MSETFGSRAVMCFEVEKVIGVSSDGNYQVQWAPAWVSKFHLVGCEHLIQEFIQRNQQKQQQQQPQHQQQQQQQPQQPQELQSLQQRQRPLEQPLEIPDTTLMNVRYEEDDEEEVEEPCDELTQLQSSTPPLTSHNNNTHLSPGVVSNDIHLSPGVMSNDIHLSPGVINNDIHLNNPEVETMLQQMNTFITDTTELVDGSGYSYKKSFVDNPQVKQEDVEDSQLVEESCTTNSNKVTYLFVDKKYICLTSA